MSYLIEPSSLQPDEVWTLVSFYSQDKMETLRGSAPCSEFHSWLVSELGFKSESAWLRPRALMHNNILLVVENI